MAPWLAKIFADGGGSILKPISDIIGEVITNKEERIQAETKLKEV